MSDITTLNAMFPRNGMHEIIRKFCGKKWLSKKHTIRIESNGYREYVYLDNPLVLARLAGHVKHNLGQPIKGYQIFMRGQPNDYPGMVPSIFRNIPKMSNNYKNRVNAYNDLIHRLREMKNLKRFKGPIGGALLQHYGIRTPWIDLVDNLFIALWFATRERSQKEPFRYVKRSAKDYGWIYFIQVEDPPNKKFAQEGEGIITGKRTMWCDLRCYQTSLSLRAHTQHGIFASRNRWDETNYDLDEFVVATVKFPITSAFTQTSDFNIFSMGYMFPSPYYDHTYKILKKGEVSTLIYNTERDNGLDEGELGRIYKYVSY
jgi:hypothetical protein